MKYDEIKLEAVARGVHAKDLLALADANDPFYCGTPAKVQKAKWFADLWERYGFESGVHLRRIHYRLVSADPPGMRDTGEPYENTEKCWDRLQDASTAARYLGLVDPLAIVDRRNPEPEIFLAYAFRRKPDFTFSPPELLLPDVVSVGINDASFEVSGYEWSPEDEEYHLELWIEKSTMRDEIAPICERLHVNYTEGKGFASITGMISLLRRARESGKPTRVFWLSDFDPGGECMPVAAARQLEFWREKYAPDTDIRLMNLFLTKEQCKEYALPRSPIKEDKRKAGFEERHGQGATELDALAALHPGELERIVEEAILRYRDPGHAKSMRDAKAEAWVIGRGYLEGIVQPFREDLGGIEREVETIRERFEAELEPLAEQFNDLSHAMVQGCEQGPGPALPDRPAVEVSGDSPEEDWLFDSSRSYDEQIEAYRRYKPRTPTPRKPPGGLVRRKRGKYKKRRPGP